MKFPILIKKNRVFVWYSNHWINTHLMSLSNGGGIRGYYRFIKQLLLCVFGKHTYHSVYRINRRSSRIECAYCLEEKECTK